MWTEQSARPHLQDQNLQHLAIPSSGDCMFLMHLIVDEDGDKFTMELGSRNKLECSCIVASLCSTRPGKAVARRWQQQAALTNVGFYSFHIRSFLPFDPPSPFDPSKFRPSIVFVPSRLSSPSVRRPDFSSTALPSHLHLLTQSRFCQSANSEAEKPLCFYFVLDTFSELLAVSKSRSSQGFHLLRRPLTFSFNG
jgi:hypothetical protein